MRRADVSSTHHERPAGVARRFQIAEDDICPATAQRRHVLDEHPAWPEFADDAGDLPPEATPVPVFEAGAFPRRRDILAGEAAGDEIDPLEVPGVGESDVAAPVDGRPVSGKDVLTVRLAFDLPAHGEARSLQAKAHPPDAGEEVPACHGHQSRLVRSRYRKARRNDRR